MQPFRIIELKPMKVARSKPLTSPEAFESFVKWFSAYQASLSCELSPRDFMYFDEKINSLCWMYALPDGTTEEDCAGFEVAEFPFGLYAVGVCQNGDFDNAEDWEKTRNEISDWVKLSERFELYENAEGKPERYPMFHITSPGWLMRYGISLEDLYVPITLKK